MVNTAPPSEPLRPFPNLQSMLQHSGSLPAQPGSSLSCINWTLKDSCTLQIRSEGQRLETMYFPGTMHVLSAVDVPEEYVAPSLSFHPVVHPGTSMHLHIYDLTI